MDLKAEFKSSFIRRPSLSAGISEYELLGDVYEKDPKDLPSQLISVLSHGNISCQPPFSYHIRSLNCYMLLLTTSGKGILNYDGNSLTLCEKSLLFFDCRQPFSLGIDSSSWSFEIYFLDGSNMHTYYRLLEQEEKPLNLHAHSGIAQYFKTLDWNNTNYIQRNTLLDLKCFTDIFTEISLIRATEKTNSQKIPPYLQFMKKCFDYSYAENYTLQDFKDQLQISKYRLCREFSAHFKMSPLQYLNQKRIDEAKNLLCTTNVPIHEVGTAVGIDNTNHFINLFKRETGLTPNVYRQNMLNK